MLFYLFRHCLQQALVQGALLRTAIGHGAQLPFLIGLKRDVAPFDHYPVNSLVLLYPWAYFEYMRMLFILKLQYEIFHDDCIFFGSRYSSPLKKSSKEMP